jgi:hypothetical protein
VGICFQSLEKMLIRRKKKFLQISIWVEKKTEFHVDFKSVEKDFKKGTKKVISKNVTETCAFPLLLMFIKLVLLITFFGSFF